MLSALCLVILWVYFSELSWYSSFLYFQTETYCVEDLLRTCTEHIATMVANACLAVIPKLTSSSTPSVLVTGGGALNKYLMERIQVHMNGLKFSLEQADEATINFKEALIFAFLGLRCLLGEENVFKETTGAQTDTVAGSIHRPMMAGKAKHISLLSTTVHWMESGDLIKVHAELLPIYSLQNSNILFVKGDHCVGDLVLACENKRYMSRCKWWQIEYT